MNKKRDKVKQALRIGASTSIGCGYIFVTFFISLIASLLIGTIKAYGKEADAAEYAAPIFFAMEVIFLIIGLIWLKLSWRKDR